MNEKITNYIDYLFRNAPNTAEALELREEILQNVNDKYNDHLAKGSSPEDAFNIAVASIGNIDVLLNQLNTPNTPPMYTQEEIETSRKRSGIFTAVAVALYILSPMMIILFGEMGNNGYLGLGLFFSFIAVATGLLIYNGATKKTNPANNTVVDDFREYQFKNSKSGKLEREVKHITSLVLLVAYFVISFATGAWYITWVIFIIMGIANSIIHTLFEMKA